MSPPLLRIRSSPRTPARRRRPNRIGAADVGTTLRPDGLSPGMGWIGRCAAPAAAALGAAASGNAWLAPKPRTAWNWSADGYASPAFHLPPHYLTVLLLPPLQVPLPPRGRVPDVFARYRGRGAMGIAWRCPRSRAACFLLNYCRRYVRSPESITPRYGSDPASLWPFADHVSLFRCRLHLFLPPPAPPHRDVHSVHPVAILGGGRNHRTLRPGHDH